tara:strand:+ start:123 stop:485 length:363 start_codon:yes stop_codon:yes gene_type:complete
MQMGINTQKSDGEFVFTQGEAKLRRLLREALEQANRVPGIYANRELRIPIGTDLDGVHARECGFTSRDGSVRSKIHYRLGTWGACVEALLAGGLETEESMEVFYDCNEWSHPRCTPLTYE